ncbi:MAG: YceI family protein [Henriciella sp.]|jgi:polyisoprenoid-binding protein YceI
MTYKNFIIGGVAAFALAACGGAGTETADVAAPAAPTETTIDTDDSLHESLQGVATGDYSLEKTHAFMTVKFGHNSGISEYRVSFTDFDGKMTFDPENPESSNITFTINPASVETNFPGNYKESHEDSEWNSWNEDVSRDKKWLNADEHPTITFTSTSAQRTGDTTGTVTGDLTLLGVTKPVTLNVSYNGSANAPWFGERDLIGFDATTTVKRSDFGMAAYIPVVGDEVTVEFSGEFLQDE